MSKLRIRYQTLEFEEFDLHLRTLRDRQQFDAKAEEAVALGVSEASWPLFGVLWDCGRALADRMSAAEVDGLRILEVGCGIGVPSLVLNARGADITATDYNPRAGVFLDANTALNDDPDIRFVRADWADGSAEELGLFDLIIGSDLLYERDHCDQLADFVAAHATREAMVVVIDPGRGGTAAFTRRMTTHGFERSHEVVQIGEDGATGKVFTFRR